MPLTQLKSHSMLESTRRRRSWMLLTEHQHQQTCHGKCKALMQAYDVTRFGGLTRNILLSRLKNKAQSFGSDSVKPLGHLKKKIPFALTMVPILPPQRALNISKVTTIEDKGGSWVQGQKWNQAYLIRLGPHAGHFSLLAPIPFLGLIKFTSGKLTMALHFINYEVRLLKATWSC